VPKTTPVHQNEAPERARARSAAKAARVREQACAHYAAHPERYHARNLRRFYNLSEEEYAVMLVAQGGRCWICGEVETRLNRAGEPWRLSVDHDHQTGAVRGLLCGRCNNGARDLEKAWRAFGGDPVLLARAAEYLARYRQQVPA
jgi:hypothetical protein